MVRDGALSGTRIVVTGGSAGLGEALVERALAQGAQVVAVARDSERLRALRERHRGEALHVIAADVADKREIHRIAGEAVAVLGGVDVLINNAGALGATPLRLALDTDCEDLEAVLAVNLVAPFRLAKALLPGMLLGGAGAVIVNLSSGAAVEAYPRWGAYSASKAALDHLSRIIDAELAEHGVRVLALDPGEMNTAMHAAALPDADPAELEAPATIARDMLALVARVRAQPAFGGGGVRYAADEWRALVRNEGGKLS